MGRPADEEHSFAVADDGTRLFVRSRNGAHDPSGLRAFFCDGILCDGFIWKYLWDDLFPILPLTHWHYRGHGRSAPPSDPDRIDIATHADDLAAVRQALGDPPSILFGHSMGCQVVLEAWRRHPRGVKAIVLLCGSFGRVTRTVHGVPVLEMILPKLLDVVGRRPGLVRAIWSRIPADMALKVALRAGEIDAEHIRPADVMPYMEHMIHVDFAMFLRMLRAAGEHDATDYLGAIDVPVLIVAGERDTLTPAFLSEAMAESIPGSELLVVKGGTHVAPLERPEAVDGRIIEFLKARVIGEP